MSELMERTEERRPMLKDAAIRNMNMREAIANGKIHLLSEVEDAIEEPSHRIDLKTNSYINERSYNFDLVEARSSQMEIAPILSQSLHTIKDQ